MPSFLPVLLLALGASPLQTLPEGPVRLEADVLELDGLTQQARTSGRSRLEGQGVMLSADELSWDRANGTVQAQGNVILVRGTLAAVAERLSVNLVTRELSAEGALFMQKEGISEQALAQLRSPEQLLRAGRTTLAFTATRVQLLEGDTYVVEDLEFTPCDCDATRPSWSVSAASARLTPGGRAHLTRPTVFVHGVPLFWSPLLSLPLSDRATGLLMPTVDVSSLSGFSLDQPLFVTLGPSYDVTLTPGFSHGATVTSGEEERPQSDFYGVKGFRLGTELNYAPSVDTRGRVSLRLLNDLRLQRDPRNPHPDVALVSKRGLRWTLKADHAQDLGGGFHDRIDASILSDGYLLRDVTSDVVAAEARFVRSTGSLYHRADDAFTGLGVTFMQDIRFGYSLLGGDVDRVGNPLPGPRPLQRLPTLLHALPERRLAGPLFGSLRVEYSRMAPLQGGTEDTGTDGIFLEGDYGAPDADGSQGNRQFEPGERTARDRLDLRPRLSLPFSAGPFLRVTPYAALRQSLYVSEVTGAQAQRGYGLAGLHLDSELARTFALGGTRLRHSVTPDLELRAATPVWEGGTPGRYDEVDEATPDAGFLQGRFTLRQRLERKSAEGRVQELAYLELSQGMDLRTRRLGTSLGRIRTELGPVTASLAAELDLEATHVPERLALVEGAARWQVLKQLSFNGAFQRTYLNMDSLRRGIDALVGEPLPSCDSLLQVSEPCAAEDDRLSLGLRGTAGASLRLGFGLGLDYGISLIRSKPFVVDESGEDTARTRLEYQTVGLSYSPSCDCWRVDTRFTLRPGSPRPEFGFTVTLAKFGSFGS